VIVPVLIELVHPTSVLDLGCGLGTWLAEFRRHGISDLHGVDGIEHDQTFAISCTQYERHDLAARYDPRRRYGLALCLEVGEHLPSALSDTLVGALAASAPVVAFSAAIPGQRGVGHINEQWPGYWRQKFAAFGYTQHDLIRARVWNDQQVAVWYRQNLFVYADPSWVPPSGPMSGPEAVVHPDLFERFVRLSQPSNHGVGALLRAVPSSALRAVRRRVATT
jgi:hypothetical protein